MKLSVKSDYAARAVLGLSKYHASGQAVKADTLAAEQGVPANYLVQILLELKSQKIVRSLRGKAGGYQLAKPPSEITLGEVIRCVHGQVFDTQALAESHCPPELRAAWESLQRAVDHTADGITFQALQDRVEARQRMYYI